MDKPEPSVLLTHALHSLRVHDHVSPDDHEMIWVWPSKSHKVLMERVRLLPLSPISSAPPSSSSSSSSSRSQSRSCNVQALKTSPSQPKRDNIAVTYAQVAVDASRSGLGLTTPSFRSSSASLTARPATMLRSTSSPTLASGRPLSLSELISFSREDDQENENNLPPHCLAVHRGVEARVDAGALVVNDASKDKDGQGEYDQPDQLEARRAYARRRCHSSPSPAASPRIPLSSFIDIWR